MAHPAASQGMYLVIGRVVAPRGVRGELKIAIETDDPERFHLLDEVYLGEGLVQIKVKRARLHGRQAWLQLEGIEDRATAEQWRDAYVYVPIEQALPLAEGEFFYYQIEGLTAITVEGKELGRVIEVLPTGANDVYLVQGDDGEILLPALKEVIVRIDLDAGVMVVRVPEGLL